MKPKVVKQGNALLKAGWWVALTLKPGSAPLRCYVGQIQALSDDGIRLTLVERITGMAGGYDFYVPHRNIESALVCTEQHDLDGFGERAGKWQEQMDAKEKEGNRGAEDG